MVMQKRPDDPEGGEVRWNRDEVESHSSNLTNQRLFNVSEVLWSTGMQAMSHPATDPVDFALCAFEYFGAATTLYISAVPMFMTKNNETVGAYLVRLVAHGNRLKRKIRSKRVADDDMLGAVEDLIEISMQMHYLMTIGMQNLKYLFRIGAQEPRGLDAHLELFAKSTLWRQRADGQVEGVSEVDAGESEA